MAAKCSIWRLRLGFVEVRLDRRLHDGAKFLFSDAANARRIGMASFRWISVGRWMLSVVSWCPWTRR